MTAGKKDVKKTTTSTEIMDESKVVCFLIKGSLVRNFRGYEQLGSLSREVAQSSGRVVKR